MLFYIQHVKSQFIDLIRLKYLYPTFCGTLVPPWQLKSPAKKLYFHLPSKRNPESPRRFHSHGATTEKILSLILTCLARLSWYPEKSLF